MLDRIKNNPVLVLNLVGSLAALFVAFGFDLSKEQTAAILAVTSALLAIVARSQVTPTRKLEG